ncbi:hypothetical protein [Pantanalinema sp. GBBB05]|uniref:hypothetical protein n=1 Tax=Pantanalinema sp. GBBB05 TaxID=2604139 RepID=UPI001D4E61D4|nr:hypothetical protein [Pantanalinema sp. GBBB05]
MQWRKCFRLPQTIWLLVGAGLAYLCFITVLGIQLIVLLSGGAIALITIIWWFRQIQPHLIQALTNLLDRDVYLTQLRSIKPAFITISPPPIFRQTTENTHNSSTLITRRLAWQQTYQWAKEAHQYAKQIANQQATLTPELLEALYTVLALVELIVRSLEVLDQVKTSTYKHLAQQHFQASCDRLQATHNQLQQLHDQVMISDLHHPLNPSETDLPHRLQLVVDANKLTLQQLHASFSQPGSSQ